jgi:dTDP-4-amino-4,6-dideoxygalactose transaminase
MIKFLDLKAINDSYEPELSSAVHRVLDSGWYLLGKEAKAFEEEYASFIGSKHCIGVANGLDALRLVLKAWIEMGFMKEGDEVIVPANTYIASILAITDNRLKPVLVEPDINTYNIDLSRIEYSITDRTRAIMVVHLYGRACWSDQLLVLAKKYNLWILEDNAQAAGSILLTDATGNVNRKSPICRTGSLGDASGHSFYPGKNLGALGDGGAVTTNDDSLAEVIRSIANYGTVKKYVNNYKGLNSRLDEIQAAFLRTKLIRLDYDNNHRRKVAEYYINNITNPKIILPSIESNMPVSENASHIWHLFVIRTQNRDRLQQYLIENGIQTLVHYPIPPHKQKAYKELNNLSLPVTEKIHREVISLPISQVISDDEVNKVVQTLNNYAG